MNFLKGLLSFILSIVLFILLTIFSFNILFKGVVQPQLIGGLAKKQLVSEYIEKEDIDHKEEIEKLLEDKEADKIANNLVNDYMKYLSDNSYKVSKKTVNNIINFCVNHREEINNISNTVVTENEIKSQETFDDLYNKINDGFKEINKKIGKTPQEVIKIYVNLTSNNITLVLIISIIICVILLILIKGSLYKWISTFGSSLISCGIMVIGLYFILNYLVLTIINKQNFNLNIKINQVLTLGLFEIIIGIVMIIVKIIISKIQEKTENNVKPSLEEEKSTTNVSKNELMKNNQEQSDISYNESKQENNN